MAFPFSIKYSSLLEGKVNLEDYPLILKQISDFIIDKPATDIVIENNELRFNPGSSGSRLNLMNPIGRGAFFFITKKEQAVLSYEFFMYKHFIYSSIMAAVMGFASQSISFGIIAFLWFYGAIWIVTLAKHNLMFDELITEINSATRLRNLNEEASINQ